MIINKEEVEKAAAAFIIKEHLDGYSDMYYKETFKAGVEFSEKYVQKYVQDIIIENQGLKLYKDNEAERFKKLAIEFLNWYQKNTTTLSGAIKYWDTDLEDWVLKPSEELFETFLKKRNETNS